MNQRYHSLDNLRGIIMWLGVVLHVCINHMAGVSNIPWRDSQTGEFADILLLFIHTFRMPAFFILAGFFTAFLLEKSSTRQMLIHRMKRLAVPFAIFWPILLIATMPLMQSFIERTVETPLTKPSADEMSSSTITTMHLWFLYYLIWFCLFGAVIHKITRKLPTSWKEKSSDIFSLIATNWWGVVLLTLPLVAIGSFFKYGLLDPDTTLIPNVFNLTHNGIYFVFGWLCFYHSNKLFNHYQRYCWHYVVSGFVIFMAVMVEFGMVMQGKLGDTQGSIIIAATYNSISWIWSFALIGIFLRYLNKPNRVLRYLADSSYWVYLVHMLGTIGFGLILYDTNLSMLPKMLINIVLTSVVCLITYQLFVRHTWIGRLLNGPRSTPKEAPTSIDQTPADGTKSTA
ncbi:MAG: acyltransferase family protein [Cellvibrionaceae bacterium]